MVPNNNTGYNGNPRLKRAHTKSTFTEERIKEYVKCAADPIYFIKTYCKIISIDKGLVPFELWPFQEEMILSFEKNRFSIAKMPRQVGKCFSINTIVKIRSKKTDLVEEITIGELYARQLTNHMQSLSKANERFNISYISQTPNKSK